MFNMSTEKSNSGTHKNKNSALQNEENKKKFRETERKNKRRADSIT